MTHKIRLGDKFGTNTNLIQSDDVKVKVMIGYKTVKVWWPNFIPLRK